MAHTYENKKIKDSEIYVPMWFGLDHYRTVCEFKSIGLILAKKEEEHGPNKSPNIIKDGPTAHRSPRLYISRRR